MNLFLTLLIVLLAVVAIWLVRLSKTGHAPAGPAAGLCAVLVIVLAVVRIGSSGTQSDHESFRAQHEQYQAVCGRVLGQALLDRHPGARVLLLTPPAAAAKGSGALLESLQAVLEQNGISVTQQAVEIPEAVKERITAPDDPGMTPEMKAEYERVMSSDPGMWFDLSVLTEILNRLKGEVDLVVNTVDLPGEIRLDTLPGKGRAPALVLLNVYLPEPEVLLERTVLDMAVSYRNNAEAWKPGAKVPKDPQTAFDLRYELLTADDR